MTDDRRSVELHAEQWLTIPGRGKVAVISTPCPDPSLLKGQVVLIDGKQYLVRGVEMFRPRKPEDSYGLLVREYEEELMGTAHKHFRCTRCGVPMTHDTGVCLRCRYLAGREDDGEEGSEAAEGAHLGIFPRGVRYRGGRDPRGEGREMRDPQAPAQDPQDGHPQDREVGTCWCCGEACMFCHGKGGCDPCCWCALCKISGCPACCGCLDCHNRSQGSYSPEHARVSHGGYPLTHEWRDIP